MRGTIDLGAASPNRESGSHHGLSEPKKPQVRSLFMLAAARGQTDAGITVVGHGVVLAAKKHNA